MTNNEKKKMTISAIVPDPWNYAHPEDNYCPFDLVPGSNGGWLLWWREEETWVASFPSLKVAHRVIIGVDKDCPSESGWDRSRFPIDVKVTLKRIRHRTGEFPQFELSETANIFDFYVPLGLGFEALSRLIYYQAACCAIDQTVIDNYCPVVAQCLSAAERELTPDMVARITPILTELLLRQTKAQIRLEREMTGSGRMVSKLKASKVRSMSR
jgi:hypothetical protein